MHTYVYTNILYTTKYYEKIMYTIYIYIQCRTISAGSFVLITD